MEEDVFDLHWLGDKPLVVLELKEALEADKPLRDVVPDLDSDDRKILSGFGLLSAKPLLILLNIGENQLGEPAEKLVAELRERFGGSTVGVDALSGQIEMEIGRLDEESAEIFMSDLGISESSLDRIIRVSFDLLGLKYAYVTGYNNSSDARLAVQRNEAQYHD